MIPLRPMRPTATTPTQQGDKMAWNYFELTITKCNQCYHSGMDANKTRVECAALGGKQLCWLGDDEHKLQTIPDFCPYLDPPVESN